MAEYPTKPNELIFGPKIKGAKDLAFTPIPITYKKILKKITVPAEDAEKYDWIDTPMYTASNDEIVTVTGEVDVMKVDWQKGLILAMKEGPMPDGAMSNAPDYPVKSKMYNLGLGEQVAQLANDGHHPPSLSDQLIKLAGEKMGQDMDDVIFGGYTMAEKTAKDLLNNHQKFTGVLCAVMGAECGDKISVRIGIGVPIIHDFEFFQWPNCKPPESEEMGSKLCTKFPEALFTAEWMARENDPDEANNGYWRCVREGYGGDTFEGHGPIHVSGKHNVILA